MPFVAAFAVLASWVSGPWAYFATVITLVFCFIAEGASEGGGHLQRVLKVLFWCACGVGVVQLMALIFPFARAGAGLGL